MILILTTVSPGDHQRHVEAQHEGEGNPTVEVSKVDADLLKILLHRLIIAQAETVAGKPHMPVKPCILHYILQLLHIFFSFLVPKNILKN